MIVQMMIFRLREGVTEAPRSADVLIRGLSARDESDSIAAVAESSQGEGSPGLAPAGAVAALSSRTGRSVTAWMAWIDGTPVGLVASVVTGPEARLRHSIAWLLVSRHARRRGVGAALVATALRAARDRGAAEIWVETRSDWPAATAFWNAVGFRRAR